MGARPYRPQGIGRGIVFGRHSFTGVHCLHCCGNVWIIPIAVYHGVNKGVIRTSAKPAARNVERLELYSRLGSGGPVHSHGFRDELKRNLFARENFEGTQ